MWSSRDISLVIITAVVAFVFQALIFGLPKTITGIPFSNSVTSIWGALTVSLAFLLFEGRRWRFSVHNILYVFLTFPTPFVGPPFDVPPRLVSILAGIIADLLLNLIYQKSKNSNKLLWWSILVSVFFFNLIPILNLPVMPFFLTQSAIDMIVNGIIVTTPFRIIGQIAGGYLAYQVYTRVGGYKQSN